MNDFRPRFSAAPAPAAPRPERRAALDLMRQGMGVFLRHRFSVGITARTTSFSGSLEPATGRWQWRMASMSAPKLASRSCSRLAAFRPAALVGRLAPAAAPAGRSLAPAQTVRRQSPRCHQRQRPSVAASSPSAETAATAEIGDYVECTYSVQLEDGTVVDSSDAAGEQACFILGGCVAVTVTQPPGHRF